MLNMYTRIIPAGPGVTNVSPHPTLHTGAEHGSKLRNYSEIVKLRVQLQVTP